MSKPDLDDDTLAHALNIAERERDEAQAEVKRLRGLLDAEVAAYAECAQRRDSARDLAAQYVARCATALVEREEARARLRESHFVIAAIVIAHEEGDGEGLTVLADELEAVPPDAEIVTDEVGPLGRRAINVRVRARGSGR